MYFVRNTIEWFFNFFFSSRRRHTRWPRDWSSDVCSSDLPRSTSSPGWRTPHVRRRSPRRSPRSWAAPTPLPDPAAPNDENFAARPRGPTHGEYGHMTTPAQTQASEATAHRATGRVARVTGAVIDIEFPPGAIPELYNALTIEISDTGSGLEASTLTLETAQHLGDGMVRGIALKDRK